MPQLTYEKEITGLVVIDPYNDFISEGGKIWDRIKDVAEANQCVPHMRQVLEAAQKAGIRVFYAMHRELSAVVRKLQAVALLNPVMPVADGFFG